MGPWRNKISFRDETDKFYFGETTYTTASFSNIANISTQSKPESSIFIWLIRAQVGPFNIKHGDNKSRNSDQITQKNYTQRIKRNPNLPYNMMLKGYKH
jgi:hypothetical protein